MEISKEIQELIEGQVVTLSTVKDNNFPNSIAVAVTKIVEGDKILITDGAMNQTLKDIDSNPNALILFWNDDRSYKLIGTAEYETGGKYFEMIKEAPSNIGREFKGVAILTITKII